MAEIAAETAEYEARRDGKWRLLVLPGAWSGALSAEVLSRVAAAAPGKHPQTLRLGAADGAGYYLKIYAPPSGAGRIKDFFRDSKAVRALKQSAALARHGFRAPPALAAGEERNGRSLGRAFLLTREIAALPLASALAERFAPPLDRAAVQAKRRALGRLAREIRCLHRLGFVHGDLVASNIFVGFEAGGPVFFYMDHDRTRRYSRRLPHRLWLRNLVQLNRFALPGISLRDRLRFLGFYLDDAPLGEKAARLGRRLARETRRRYGAERKALRRARASG